MTATKPLLIGAIGALALSMGACHKAPTATDTSATATTTTDNSMAADTGAPANADTGAMAPSNSAAPQ
jgi:hypothetical protein